MKECKCKGLCVCRAREVLSRIQKKHVQEGSNHCKCKGLCFCRMNKLLNDAKKAVSL